MSDHRPDSQGNHLLRVTVGLGCLATLFGSVEAVVSVALAQPRMAATGVALLALAGLSFWARGLVHQGRIATAASLLSYAVLTVVLVRGAALPFTYPTLACGSVLAAVVGLPYLEGPAVRRLVVAASACLLAVVANGYLYPAPLDLPRWMQVVTGIGEPLAAGSFTLYLLWQFSMRLRVVLDGERAAWNEANGAREQAMFLAQASAVLAESLDLEATLRQLGQLAVARLADWFTVSVVSEDGSLMRMEVAHRDVSRRGQLEEYRRRYPPGEHRTDAYASVLRTGKPLFMPVVTEEVLVASAQNEEHLALLRSLGVASCMAVPMIAHGLALGVLAFVRTTPERPYDETDLAIAQDLAARAALAVENARLYDKELKAVQLRDEFLGIAGHEMKTPLTALQIQMQGLLRRIQLAAGPTPTAEILAWVRRTVNTGERLARLVDDLLDVTRISAGRLVLHPEQVDLVHLMKEVVGRYQEAASRADTQLLLSMPEALPGVWDPQRLDQIVSNLISNGLKYGHGAPVELNLQAYDGKAVIRVRDQGIGISEADQSRIFDRFERAAPSRNYGGLGLGLWIVREIVQACGGSIRVESAPGAGSTFTVTLPREVATPATPTSALPH